MSNEKIYTEAELKEMKFQEVIRTAKSVGIEYKLQKKNELIALIIEKQSGSTATTETSSTENAETPETPVVEKAPKAEKKQTPAEKKAEKTAKKAAEKTAERTAKKTAEKAEKTAKKPKKTADEGESKKRVAKTQEEKRQEVLDVISDAQKAILEDDTLLKSEKMRRLFKKDLSVAQISHLLNAHYSFVFGVISRYRKLTESPAPKKEEKAAE